MSLKLTRIEGMNPNKKARIRREAENGARVDIDHGNDCKPMESSWKATAKSASVAATAAAADSSTLVPASSSFRLPLTTDEKDRRRERKVRETEASWATGRRARCLLLTSSRAWWCCTLA
jgi:hypothetical protein